MEIEQGACVCIRCRKCREILLSKTTSAGVDDCCKTFDQLESIFEDDNQDDSQIPEWIRACFTENEWRKGKLLCPGCGGKVGSFNFIAFQKCSCGRRQSPSAFFYKSRIDICRTSPLPADAVARIDKNRRDHCRASFKKQDGEWMVAFEKTLTAENSGSSPEVKRKSHRKSYSWTATNSSASNWLASTFADVSSHLDAAAMETKQVLLGTLDLAGRITSPIPSAIGIGHRKTKSWGGSIKTTLSTLLGGFFSNDREASSGSESTAREQQFLSPVAESNSSISDISNASQSAGLGIATQSVSTNDYLPLLTRSDDSYHFPKRKRKYKRSSNKQRVSETSNQQLRRSTSSLSFVPDYLLCSICLDLFCLPQYCLPCRHVFCEPCLKLLAHALPLPGNRFCTLCPLCRQIIRWTEPADEIITALLETSYSSRYFKRVFDYEKKPSVSSLASPGLYQLKLVRRIIRGFPESAVRYLETIWVDYTPLVTLYSFCVSLLCLLFFFTLFLPCVYLTSWLGRAFDSAVGSNEFGFGLIYQEALAFATWLVSNGILSLASIVVMVSITFFVLFVV